MFHEEREKTKKQNEGKGEKLMMMTEKKIL
jgi:hypothetical protein